MAAAGSTSSPKSVERTPGARQQQRLVEESEARRLGIEIHVLGDREVGRDIDLLRHQRDAGGLGLRDARGLIGLAGERDLAAILPRCTPARIWMKVDLPAPFWPSKARISPGAIERLTSSTATTPGNSLVMPRAETTAAPDARTRATS